MALVNEEMKLIPYITQVKLNFGKTSHLNNKKLAK